MHHISERELHLPPAMISKLSRIVAENNNIISLGAGEPDFDLPKPLVDYTKKIANKCNHYSSSVGRRDLREAIAKKVKKDNKIKANPDNVFVSSGSQESLFLALAATTDVSEQVIVPNPSYLGYVPAIDLLDATPVFINAMEQEGWKINPDAIKKAVNKKTTAIIINTPSNPTGNVASKKILEEVADIAVDNDIYIISDEAYEKIIYEKKHVSIGSFNGMKNHVITMQTFSKSYAMCGYRIGYCIGPEEIIKSLENSHSYSTICAPTISQMLAVKALSLPSKYVNSMIAEYKRRRNFIVHRLNEIDLHTHMPSGAFYAFSRIPKASRTSSWKFAEKLLEKSHVAVFPGTEFGSAGEGYIRLSFATKMPLIEKAMDRIEKFLKNR